MIPAVTNENVVMSDDTAENFQKAIVAAGELSENENPVFRIILASPAFNAIGLRLIAEI